MLKIGWNMLVFKLELATNVELKINTDNLFLVSANSHSSLILFLSIKNMN